MKYGIMGAKGSFSEQAARHFCAQNKDNSCDIVYLVSAEKVLSALESGDVDMAVFPIENSNGGVVIEAIYAMARHQFTVTQLFEIEVKHNLLVMPGVKANDIKVVSSHDQALKQCRMYLKRVWPTVELKEYADTALAAKDLHEGILSKDTAVIAPRVAAELYGLEILEEGIQDLKFNYTTFIAAERLI